MLLCARCGVGEVYKPGAVGLCCGRRRKRPAAVAPPPPDHGAGPHLEPAPDGAARRPRKERTLPEPTDALPGTPEKVAVLEERARRGQQLWHPLDRLTVLVA